MDDDDFGSEMGSGAPRQRTASTATECGRSAYGMHGGTNVAASGAARIARRATHGAA